MKASEKVFTWLGVGLSVIGVLITWSIHWLLGLFTTLVAVGAYLYWRRLTKTGAKYLREFAEKTGLTYIDDPISYGQVKGNYKGYPVSLAIINDYDSDRGIPGFLLTQSLFDSGVGAVAGIENIAVLELKHNKIVTKPRKIDERTFLDTEVIVYIPPIAKPSGLPDIPVEALKKRLDRLVKIAKTVS